jgi:hypothetical protein
VVRPAGSPALWSLRLDVGERSAVIALGGPHVHEDVVVYEADELVTIFDATTALAYRPQPEDESAWGSLIAGGPG